MEKSKPFKYATEAGVNLYLRFTQTCQQDEFKFLEKPPYLDGLKYYNIYFICSRNRIGIDSSFIQVDDHSIYLKFNVWEGDIKFEVPVAINNIFQTNDLLIISKPPHSYFEIKKNKKSVFGAKSAYILDGSRSCIFPRPEFLDFEILYIGQATRNSETPTIDRLINHSTLQKIYSENPPDKEIYIILCSFVLDGTVEMKANIETLKEYEEEDTNRLMKFLKSELKLTPAQTTTLAEAALIKYFQPHYNLMFKDSFPSKTHSSYDECYKLDLNAVSIEIDTDIYFFTKKVKKKARHFKRYFLVTDENRRKLFEPKFVSRKSVKKKKR